MTLGEGNNDGVAPLRSLRRQLLAIVSRRFGHVGDARQRHGIRPSLSLSAEFGPRTRHQRQRLRDEHPR